MENVNTKSDFPTMGEEVAHHVMNMSRGTRYTKTVARQTMGRGSSPTGRKVNRGSTMIKEANGPCCTVKATLYAANAPDAGKQLRNVHMMPTAVGNRDFWAARQRSESNPY